ARSSETDSNDAPGRSIPQPSETSQMRSRDGIHTRQRVPACLELPHELPVSTAGIAAALQDQTRLACRPAVSSSPPRSRSRSWCRRRAERLFEDRTVAVAPAGGDGEQAFPHRREVAKSRIELAQLRADERLDPALASSNVGLGDT